MLLERTITQLDIGAVPHLRAVELGQLGYLQWLRALPGHADYRKEALSAYAMAEPFARTSPAVAVFCDLLTASTRMPPVALELRLPKQRRRGGARARRAER